MPWCETCSRFLNPNSLEPDGTCPTCGRVVAEPSEPGAATSTTPTTTSTAAEAEREKAPWHFKLLVAVTVVYLAWRAVEMVGWVVN
jgi:hypothetical protein